MIDEQTDEISSAVQGTTCRRWPEKERYFSERHATRACSGIARKLANRNRLAGPLAPYVCRSGGVEHWHLGRRTES